jgi:RNA polymerase sigma-70 factor (family 1)
MKGLNLLPDQQLLSLIAEGNEHAFTEIYNRYWDRLYVTAFNRLADEQEAEEATQNVFMSLWKRRETIELNCLLSTYLSTAVKYQIFSRLAQLNRQNEHIAYLTQTTVEGSDTTTDWLSERELKQRLEKCVSALPEKCQIVFLMSREKGLSNSLIAQKLNIAEKTVEGHITKALSILRSSL